MYIPYLQNYLFWCKYLSYFNFIHWAKLSYVECLVLKLRDYNKADEQIFFDLKIDGTLWNMGGQIRIELYSIDFSLV